MPYLLLFIGCIFLGLGVLGLFVPRLQSLDLLSVQILSEYRSDYLNSITIFLARIGGMPFVLFLSFLVCIYQAWYKKYITVIFISLGVIGSITMGWLLKWCVDRPRPPQVYHIVESYGASFPSAHSVYAATLATLAIFIYRDHFRYSYVALFSYLWLSIMGVSRVYAGVHYPSDVLAGWGIGFVWISLLWLGLLKTKLDKNNLFFR